MTYIFNMHEAKSNLSKLVELVEAGEEVQIARNGAAVVDIVPTRKKARPLFGDFEPIVAEIPEGFDIDQPVLDWEEALATKGKFLKAAQSGVNQ